MRLFIFGLVGTLLFCTSCTFPFIFKKTPEWVKQIEHQVKKLEKSYNFEFGIYIKDIKEGQVFSYKASQYWYLSSTVKIPIAIAVLELVEQKKLDLKEKVTISSSDYRDGAGSVNWIKPGGKISYENLLIQMLVYSDNAATDLLIKKVGLTNINQKLSTYTSGAEFGPITTLLDVRRKAYSEFHLNASHLSNMSFLEIKKKKGANKRLNELAKQLKINRNQLNFQNMSEGFNQYYKKKWNSAPLTSYANILENLAFAKTLSSKTNKKLLNILARVQTGKKRIRAGLSKKLFFAHKTGTQHRQACDVGLVGSKEEKKPKLIILICTKNWKKLSQAEKLMAQIGKLVPI